MPFLFSISYLRLNYCFSSMHRIKGFQIKLWVHKPSSNTDQMKASYQTRCYTTTELEHVLIFSYHCLLAGFFRLRTRCMCFVLSCCWSDRYRVYEFRREEQEADKQGSPQQWPRSAVISCLCNPARSATEPRWGPRARNLRNLQQV